jgi:hypothetical protein
VKIKLQLACFLNYNGIYSVFQKTTCIVLTAAKTNSPSTAEEVAVDSSRYIKGGARARVKMSNHVYQQYHDLDLSIQDTWMVTAYVMILIFQVTELLIAAGVRRSEQYRTLTFVTGCRDVSNWQE